MNLGRFRFGGVHPHDSKDTADIASSALSKPPKTVLISMSQHIGAPAKMLKNKGDKVERGELIGEAGGYVSGNVHSSVTGTAASVEIASPPLGRGANALLINVDSNADNLAYFESSDYMSMPVEEMSKRIQQAGIVGMGGATFPTHVKVDGAAKGNADTLIINGVECEPYITSDYRLMIEYTQHLFKGIEILRKIIPSVKRTIIGIENNKPKAIEEMAKMGKEYNVEVMALRLRYPQGAEKMLIEATTGRIVPVSKLPMDVGVIVVNIATLYAIYEAVAKNKPLIERLVTVSGDAIKEHKNIWLPLGTPISHVVEECGGITAENVLILSGGPMMGAAIPNLEQCVNKGTNSLLFLDKDKLPKEVEYPCIKCGRCGNACPLHLSPTEIAHTAKAKIKDKLNDLDIATCFECGCCTYICPSKIPLVQWIRFGKDLLRR
ncbi:electron transport complex subunit RsxC [Brachyspira hampsonii]|uniref:Ion-translocating oxidoreductase complex subunit C n=1 Tax=Brachyspira hampsonii TaxID=1287055 RepID=A0AAC9TV32_9SPIR|nr:electron transport complex subunit RsxC [Brachyspira hampsonii]ASJ21332.1 electron transport complex subunit RsxC [Brachyspira hampsonii]ELV05514.1 electron transport complex protein [Brachyspira hampsonii 30599]MBW5379653.1 electron transport complex subunit RsxC [Brachyspira hampsonii]MBW5408810.1 electron transport complex subunit RsxC [Brachyspira hampsonii]OEJ18749.1 electron transporter [Brachyspira hampsonii]